MSGSFWTNWKPSGAPNACYGDGKIWMGWKPGGAPDAHADSEISTARENTKAALANQPGNVRKVVYEEYPDLVPW